MVVHNHNPDGPCPEKEYANVGLKGRCLIVNAVEHQVVSTKTLNRPEARVADLLAIALGTFIEDVLIDKSKGHEVLWETLKVTSQWGKNTDTIHYTYSIDLLEQEDE